MDSRVKLRVGPGMSTYEVLVDGLYVGEVRKKETRYNLRRAFTNTSWYGLTADSDRVPTFGGYSTRQDAIEALVKATDAQP